MKEKIVYKVVEKMEDKYCSAWVGGWLRLQYKIGAITKAVAKTIGICVFPSLEDAINYHIGKGSFDQVGSHILKCKAVGKVTPRTFLWRYGTLQWQGLDEGRKTRMVAPKGTAVCPAVIPLEVVQ